MDFASRSIGGRCLLKFQLSVVGDIEDSKDCIQLFPRAISCRPKTVLRILSFLQIRTCLSFEGVELHITIGNMNLTTI